MRYCISGAIRIPASGTLMSRCRAIQPPARMSVCEQKAAHTLILAGGCAPLVETRKFVLQILWEFGKIGMNLLRLGKKALL